MFYTHHTYTQTHTWYYIVWNLTWFIIFYIHYYYTSTYIILFSCANNIKLEFFSFIITMLYIMNFKHTDIWPTLSPSNKFRFQMYVCEICAHYTSLKYYTSFFLKLFSVLSSIFKRSVVFNLIVRLDLRVLMDLKNPL